LKKKKDLDFFFRGGSFLKLNFMFAWVKKKKIKSCAIVKKKKKSKKKNSKNKKMSTRKERAALENRIKARMKENATKGKNAKKKKERTAATKQELEVEIVKRKKEAEAEKTLLERIAKRSGTYECPEGFKKLKEEKRNNEQKRFNEAIEQRNKKALALRGSMKKTIDGKWCEPTRKNKTFRKFLNKALRKTKEERISKPDLKAFNKRLNVLTSDQKKEEQKRIEQAVEQYRAEIRNQNVEELEEKAKAKGVWINLSNTVKYYLGLKAAEACEKHDYCPKQPTRKEIAKAALADRLTVDPGPARAETKEDIETRNARPTGHALKKRIEARKKSPPLKGATREQKIEAEISRLKQCLDTPDMEEATTLGRKYMWSSDYTRYNNECKALHEMGLIEYEDNDDDTSYYWYYIDQKDKVFEDLEKKVKKKGLNYMRNDETQGFWNILKKGKEVKGTFYNGTKDYIEIKLDDLTSMEARLCITLATIVPKAFQYDNGRRYYWYNVEDQQKVEDAISNLGRERIDARENRAMRLKGFDF
jgi:hypothetical protein